MSKKKKKTEKKDFDSNLVLIRWRSHVFQCKGSQNKKKKRRIDEIVSKGEKKGRKTAEYRRPRVFFFFPLLLLAKALPLRKSWAYNTQTHTPVFLCATTLPPPLLSSTSLHSRSIKYIIFKKSSFFKERYKKEKMLVFFFNFWE